MIISPGTYLAKRRQAAGLSIADVAARLATEPRVAEHVRVEWIDLIERDEMPAAFATIVALRRIYPFDLRILAMLVACTLYPSAPPPRICRVCACSQFDACPDGCGWAEHDRCSACPAEAVAA